MKTCNKCAALKTLSDFAMRKFSSGNAGHVGTCKKCVNDAYRAQARVRMARNRQADGGASSRAKVKLWKKNNPDKKRTQDQRNRNKGTWREGLTQEQIDQIRSISSARKKLIAVLSAVVSRETADPEFCLIWNRPGMGAAWRFRTRYRLDPAFAIRQRLRARGRRMIRRDKVSALVRAAICRGGTSPKAEAMLGYPVADLMRHLERQFVKGMSWCAFSRGQIHIDHIMPLASFDLSDESEWQAAWRLTNLRPLWANDNIRKGSKVVSLI